MVSHTPTTYTLIVVRFYKQIFPASILVFMIVFVFLHLYIIAIYYYYLLMTREIFNMQREYALRSV